VGSVNDSNTRDVSTDANVLAAINQVAGSGFAGINRQVINIGSVHNASVRNVETSVLVVGVVSQFGATAGTRNTQTINLGGVQGR
jgi:hypothetical protein